TREGGTEMVLVGWPNEREQRVDGVAVPKLLSVLVSGDPDKPVPGLDRVPPQDRPPVAVPFATYHVMVYTWGAMTGLVALAVVRRPCWTWPPTAPVGGRREGRDMDLPSVWFVLLGVFLAGYAVLDGFDLGVGVLHLFARGDAERAELVESIGPFWSGNEVWLVVFGGALFAAFPNAYAAAFTTMYLP